MMKVSGNPVLALQGLKQIRKLRRSANGNHNISKFVKSGNKYYWATDFPGFPSSNLKEFMQFEFIRFNQTHQSENNLSIPQQTIIWGITNRCGLKCSHCYDWENIDSKEHLTVEQLKQVFLKIENHGIRHVQLSGGEPLVRFNDLASIVKLNSEKTDFWLLTSGFGLTPEKANKLKEAGLIGVNISLDHWDEQKHNSFRNNPKSYYWVMEAIHNCRNAGILISLSLCATREFVTVENLKKYALLAKSMGVNFIRILEPRAVGNFSGQKVHLSPDQIKILTQFLEQMNSKSEYKKFPIVIFFGYHQRNLGCMGSGNRYMYIDANGEIHACPFCRGSVGNIFSLPLNDAIGKLREKGCQAFKMYS